MDIKPTARVTFLTPKGSIEIELFAKELPLSCREFLNNCTSKRYVGLQFATATPGLIQTSQLSSSTNIKQERNNRIKFKDRGAVGLLKKKDTKLSSASGFFISLESPSQYSSEHVFIGNVVGESIYNVVKIGDSELQEGTENLSYPVPITDCIVSEPHFEDLEKESIEADTRKRKKPKSAVKLDFGDDDEDAETEPMSIKIKHASGSQVSVNKTNVSIPDSTLKSEEDKNVRSSEVLTSTSASPSELPGPPIAEEAGNTKPAEDKEEEATSEPEGNDRKRPKLVRNDSVDSYDSDLDFSQDEVTFEALRQHKFICR